MSSNQSLATFAFTLVCAVTASGDEPQRLAKLREQFESLRHPTETDRVRYITALVRLRESFTRADYKKMKTIDSEIIKHPMRSDIEPADLRKRLIGQWTSPRHSYLYRADGTWTMLPEVVDGSQSTHGVWRIEGNKFFQRATVEPPESDTGETIVILTDTDFVWSTHVAPYYMRRGDVYPWR
jgi:hypothetical protein